MRLRPWIGALAAIAALLAVAVPSAAAEGGPTVAAAPAVVYGLHETGNTANGGKAAFQNDCYDVYENKNSFWQLPVTVGDQVKIDWGAVILDSTCLSVYPAGTTDFSLPSTEEERSTEQGPNGKQEMVFTAPTTGNLIIDFAGEEFHSGCTACAGPYEFTAFLQHTLQLALSAPPVLQTNSTVTVAVTQNTGTPVPDGLVLGLRARWSENGEKKFFDAAASTVGGVASFPLALPASAIGRTVTLTASRAEDGSYVSVASNSVKARIEAPPVPVHHHRRHHHHHRHHHHRHRHHH
jgi:hypothetical protein